MPTRSSKKDVWTFLKMVADRCVDNGVKLRLLGIKRTRAGDLGCFDEISKVMTVCVGYEQWPMILAHESAHMDQNAEGFLTNEFRGKDLYTLFEKWCKGKVRVRERELKRIVTVIQRTELDAERRAVKMASQFCLSDDIPNYIRRANIYIWKYEVARRLGFWPKYLDDKAIAEIPSRRLMSIEQISRPPQSMIDLAIRP